MAGLQFRIFWTKQGLEGVIATLTNPGEILRHFLRPFQIYDVTHAGGGSRLCRLGTLVFPMHSDHTANRSLWLGNHPRDCALRQSMREEDAMTTNLEKIVDGDGHINEDLEAIAEYLPAKFRDHPARVLNASLFPALDHLHSGHFVETPGRRDRGADRTTPRTPRGHRPALHRRSAGSPPRPDRQRNPGGCRTPPPGA